MSVRFLDSYSCQFDSFLNYLETSKQPCLPNDLSASRAADSGRDEAAAAAAPVPPLTMPAIKEVPSLVELNATPPRFPSWYSRSRLRCVPAPGELSHDDDHIRILATRGSLFGPSQPM